MYFLEVTVVWNLALPILIGHILLDFEQQVGTSRVSFVNIVWLCNSWDPVQGCYAGKNLVYAWVKILSSCNCL